MRKRHAVSILLVLALGLSLFLLTGCDKCKKGHTYGEGVYREVCGDYGYVVYTCTKCEQVKVTKSDTFYPHDYYLDYRTEATCQKVEANHYRCSTCGHQKTEYGDERAPHQYADEYTVDIPATSTSAGEKSRHCTVEGCDARTDVTTIAKVEPDFPWVPA